MAKASKTQIVKKEAPAALAPLEPWEMELAKEAKAEVAKEATGIPRISHKGGVLKIDGQAVAGNKLQVGIIDFVFAKAYYEGEFNDQVAQTPVCYAFAREEAGMVPHTEAPKKQNATCAGCPHNAFGTAERGRGKRCKDERRLGVVVSVNDPDSVQEAEVRTISVPPGSLKNWAAYLRKIPDITPTGNVRAVLTEISTEPAGGAYALTFKPVAKLAGDTVKAIMAKKEQVGADLMLPYPNIEQPEQPAPRSRPRRSRID
jgi:hypothetical protein